MAQYWLVPSYAYMANEKDFIHWGKLYPLLCEQEKEKLLENNLVPWAGKDPMPASPSQGFWTQFECQFHRCMYIFQT